VAELTKEIWIDAPPEKVYRYLVEPDLTVRWFGEQSWNEPHSGGLYRVSVRGHVVRGEFVELDPPRRLVYTWGWEPGGGSSLPPGSTRIEIDLIPDGDGTRLLFAHRDLPTAEEARRHGLGWDHYLGRLATIAAGGDPGPDPMVERGPTR
jgi:uncharacterized protein YndB with AHSA1/START domain